jgi:hypothetical protein
VGRRAQIHQGALQPASYAQAVATIDITELALEIGFLAGHYAVADDEREEHQYHQQPEIVERDGQADQTQEHAEVDGVAREAVRSALDDGGGRQVGGDVRTGPGDRADGPGDQRQREDKHDRAEPACRQVGRQERQGHEPVERQPGKDGKPLCKRRPNKDLSGICRVIHGGTVNPRSLSMSPCRLGQLLTLSPGDAPLFVVAQFLEALAGMVLVAWLLEPKAKFGETKSRA